MSEPRDPVTPLLSSLAPSEPPASLRARTLSRAARVWEQPAPPDRWRQVRESRPLRLAWAAAVVALIVANLTLPSWSGSPAGRALPPEVAASAAQDRELQELVELPRLRETLVAIETVRPAGVPDRADSTDLDKEKST
ncbi:MAG TPA: hypothetical protein PLS53_12725 [Thermoanaerobaculaceae bacterium]|nr:hypothetical protein [Thermoanaerobaculaceae bacterium]HPS79014.1 hypothetical protein [Thermoanaerobaculaceae bacterium]